jgi:hypothetical protein
VSTDPATIARDALIETVKRLVLDHDISPEVIAAEGERLLAESRTRSTA